MIKKTDYQESRRKKLLINSAEILQLLEEIEETLKELEKEITEGKDDYSN